MEDPSLAELFIRVRLETPLAPALGGEKKRAAFFLIKQQPKSATAVQGLVQRGFDLVAGFDIARYANRRGAKAPIAGHQFGSEAVANDNGLVRGASPRNVAHRFARLFAEHGLPIDAADPVDLVLFPEMDGTADVPEITVDCWGILDVDPGSVMCASSRMVVKRKGADRPVVVACTLLPYEPEFELGHSLAEATGEVWLNHPHCARFCVLGGGSCSMG